MRICCFMIYNYIKMHGAENTKCTYNITMGCVPVTTVALVTQQCFYDDDMLPAATKYTEIFM